MEVEKKPVTVSSNNQVRVQAVLVGCNNYPNPKHRLRGSHNDVYKMRNTLINRFRYDPARIVVMVDKPGSEKMPTAANIKKELRDMVGKAQSGDRLLFLFSGHGLCYKPKDRKHAIVACDNNLITHLDLRCEVNRLPENATLTVLANSCCSGGLIDKEPVQVGAPAYQALLIDDDDDDQTVMVNNDVDDYIPRMITYESYLAQLSAETGMNDPDIGVHLVRLFGSDASIMFRLPINEHPKALKADQRILLSGPEPQKYSWGDVDEKGAPCGAFTKTVVKILDKHAGSITNRHLVMRARAILEKRVPKKYVQRPCLYCSPKNADAVFLRKPFTRAEIGEASASASASASALDVIDQESEELA
ncbi:hypothetical protein ABFS83_11G019100 [Erythranthe nasuta]